jgi:hypothetical protein
MFVGQVVAVAAAVPAQLPVDLREHLGVQERIVLPIKDLPRKEPSS